MRHRHFLILVVLFMWLGISGLVGCGSAVQRDAFGADASVSSGQPNFLVAAPSVGLTDLDKRIIVHLNAGAGFKAYYTFLPYVLPAGFHPATGWGDKKTGDTACSPRVAAILSLPLPTHAAKHGRRRLRWQ